MLTQEEYELLIKLKKKFETDDIIQLGPHPIRWSRNIFSLESHDTFILDYVRGSIEIKKYSINNRYKTSIILLRYCSHGKHTNPDGVTTFDGSHLHLYQDGYDDKIAINPSNIGITSTDDIEEVLRKILQYTNIQDIPIMQSDMF